MLAAEKTELFRWKIDDESAFTRDKASACRTEVTTQLQNPRATGVFNLRALLGLKKNGMPRARRA